MHHRFHLHFMGRHGRRHSGHFSRSPHERGRKFGSSGPKAADLELLLLAMLADKPRSGYEFIQELAAASKGLRAPGPELIYPTLTYLEEGGHATATAEGSHKRYQLTDAGRHHLQENYPAADAKRNLWERRF